LASTSKGSQTRGVSFFDSGGKRHTVSYQSVSAVKVYRAGAPMDILDHPTSKSPN
jgi:hypothetical protein